MRFFSIVAALSLAVAGCAPSPLYLGRKNVGTPGAVPRDERGEPIWSLLPPPAAAGAPELAVLAQSKPPRRRSGDVRLVGAEIPRDASGEPVWAMIVPPPQGAPLPTLASAAVPAPRTTTGN